jgi:hypothetical protein
MPVTVFLKDPADLRVDRLAPFYQKRGRVAFEARLDARRCSGALVEHVGESEAAQAVASAESVGLRVLLCSDSDIPALPAPTEVRGFRWEAENLVFVSSGGPGDVSIPWPHLVLAAAAPLKETTTETHVTRQSPSGGERALRIGLTLTTGLPLGFGKEKEIRRTETHTDYALRLDLYTLHPITRYHLEAASFHFAGLGDRLGAGARENLRTFVDEVVRRAPGLRQNRGLRALHEGTPLSALGYERMDDVDRESRWLLTLALHASGGAPEFPPLRT